MASTSRDGSRGVIKKPECFDCFEELVATARHGRIKCPKCKQNYEVTRRQPSHKQFKNKFSRNVDEALDKVSATLYTNRWTNDLAHETDAKPWGITVSSNGDILFINDKNHTLNIIPAGQIEPYGHRGFQRLGEVELHDPEDLVTNHNDDILITEVRKRRIKVLDRHGTYIRDIRVDGEPRGICVDDCNNIYVTTSYPDQVIKYDADFKEIRRMRNNEFLSRHEFECLGQLVHHRGRLYITDFAAHDNDFDDGVHHVIHVVSTELEYVTAIGEGVISHPIGITVDKHHTLLVSGLYAVVALTLGGEFIAKMPEIQTRLVAGITTNHSGEQIILSDQKHGRVIRLYNQWWQR